MTNLFLDLLDQCQPDQAQLSRAQQQLSIRRPPPDEAFVITSESKTLSCLTRPRESSDRKFVGELSYPVTNEVQNICPDRFRQICFHVCRTIAGNLFLLPQKLLANSTWNRSMVIVVELGQKHAITMASDPDLQQYVASAADVTIPSEVDDAEVAELFESVFSGLIIDRVDHPVLAERRPTDVRES